MIPPRMQLLLILTMAGWGLNISILKTLTQHYDILQLSANRMSIGAIFVVLAMVSSRQPMPFRQVTPRQWVLFAICGAMMVYLNQILFITGMNYTSATNGALIMAIGPLLASLMAAAVFREALTRQRLIGVALGFGGVFAVVVGGSGGNAALAGWGDLIIFAAVSTFIGGGMFIQSLTRHFNTLFVTSIIYVIGATMLLVHVTLLDPGVWTFARLAPGLWPTVLMVVSGLVFTAICNLFWNRAISEYGAARISVYQYWVPLFGVGFATALLGEPFSMWHWVGMAGIMLGTWLGAKAPSRRPGKPGASA